MSDIDKKYGIKTWKLTDSMESEEELLEYLEECAKEDDGGTLLLRAIGRIAREKGMTKLSKATGMSREHLYTALSDNGNPSFKSLLAIIDSLGYGIRFVRKQPSSQTTVHI